MLPRVMPLLVDPNAEVRAIVLLSSHAWCALPARRLTLATGVHVWVVQVRDHACALLVAVASHYQVSNTGG